MTGRRFLTKRIGSIAVWFLLVWLVFRYKTTYLKSIIGISWKPLLVQANRVEVDVDSAAERPTRIVFWIPPKFYVSKSSVKSRIEIQNRTIFLMNKDQNSLCRDAQLTEFANMRPCHFSFAKGNVTDADAVVLSMFNRGLNLPELPPTEHAEGIIRVALIREPPPLSYWKNPLKDQVNWAMSYRKDSDVWTPYGKTVKHTNPLKKISVGNYSLDAWISGKTKLISGVISNCHTASKREKLIKEMNGTGLAVIDIYGHCGKPFKCGRYSKNCDSSWEQLGQDYKFFLAFENSICEDYITEKLWRTLTIGIVPVVYGGGNYDRDLPPNSFINVMNFKSSLSLMTYLKFVGDNKNEYAKFFQWKKTHKVVNNGILQWCSLCKALQDRDHFPNAKVFANLKSWWQHKSYNISVPVCTKPANTRLYVRLKPDAKNINTTCNG